VTPETAEHLDKAREYLTKGRNLLDVMHYNDEAGAPFIWPASMRRRR
jgi:hypothetical protein